MPHAMRLNDHSSPLAAFSEPPFHAKECRFLRPCGVVRLQLSSNALFYGPHERDSEPSDWPPIRNIGILPHPASGLR